MEVTRLSAEAARARVLESMGLPLLVAQPERDAELLRSTLWALSVPQGDEPFREVHINRLMNLALESSLGLNEEKDEAALRVRLRESLDALVAHGDVNERGEGRYLPGSCRLVTVAGGALLVGGLPTSALPDSARRRLYLSGALRRMAVATVDGLTLPKELLRVWAHIPAEPLEEWGAQMCRQPLDNHGRATEPRALEVYAPSVVAKGAHQLQRWGPPRVEMSDGVYLARQKRVFGAQEFFLVELKAGVVARSGGFFLPGEWKRFMFFADERAKNPLRIDLNRKGDTLRAKLHGGLPLAEWRLFSALGEWADAERTWAFHRRDDHARVFECLRALRVANELELRSYE